MRDANVYNLKRAMPRMSWNHRWIAKALLRAYHGDLHPPDVRSHVIKSANLAALNKWAHRDMAAEKEAKRLELEQAKGLAPVGSLMFREVERWLDVLVFRCCFAHIVYEAWRLIIHREVMLNGQKHMHPNTRLAPDDVISTKENTGAATSTTASDAQDASECRAKEEPKSPKPKRKSDLTPFHLPPYASPSIFIHAYIEPSFATCSAVYLCHPTALPGYSEIPTPYDADGELVRAAWEWYSHVRPCMRSKRQLSLDAGE
ncbi:uncharacterized protein LAESUDRAFT_791048 [Laetiporus sulphureus 93-53]|uniref:Uncharacterized protein n=1 Tax=Laetiporus sulphureus 93-53 TaxID=1314785 RepID=A0A165CJD4_9APHY|nr:uncharacterized protein LAESUDRAFT_791048 [Laetiporus sulphureus 93-53]KZT02916.1 hypothetical protein LAESUDRAFT_791048 [Laetiporus sulphureus 93-53]